MTHCSDHLAVEEVAEADQGSSEQLTDTQRDAVTEVRGRPPFSLRKGQKSRNFKPLGIKKDR